MARLTDDLFPLPGKHTLEREEQEQEKWINLSSVKLAGEVLGQHVSLKPHCLFSFIITLYRSTICFSLSFALIIVTLSQFKRSGKTASCHSDSQAGTQCDRVKQVVFGCC